jgi:hypothetical protein
MEISEDVLLVLICCALFSGIFIGAIAVCAIKDYRRNPHPTADERRIGREMAREYQERLHDVKRTPRA